MASKKNTYKTAPKATKEEPKKRKAKKRSTGGFSLGGRLGKAKAFFTDERLHRIIGLGFILSAVYMLVAFISFLFTWKTDQDQLVGSWGALLTNSTITVDNWLGKLGAIVSHQFIHSWFGISSFLFILVFFLIGFKIVSGISLLPLKKVVKHSLFALVWVSVAMGYFFHDQLLFLGGAFGFQVNTWLTGIIGSIGTAFFLLFVLASYSVVSFNLSLAFVGNWMGKTMFGDDPSIAVAGDAGAEGGTATATAEDMANAELEAEGSATIEREMGEDGFETVIMPTGSAPKPKNKQKETPALDLELDGTEDTPAATEPGTPDLGLDLAMEAASAAGGIAAATPEAPGDALDLDVAAPVEAAAPAAETPAADDGFEVEIPQEEPSVITDAAGNVSTAPVDPSAATGAPAEGAEDEVPLAIETPAVKETILTEADVDRKVQEFGEYDPKLDLSRFELPPLELLADHGSGIIQVDRDELEANKNNIVETLGNYKIGIAKIKATVGPTVTLYEIVPEAGVRISKIKNLEDDIALSLAALGIRIIAPIPGRGTIGIEVPNSNPEIVSMKTVVASEKFQNTKMDLPLVMGKNISNETYVTDLAKAPHILMAGATGQGKSVGLNCILVSLLYKKHPSQIKFVLVDPKKVELTLFNKIERHYLAKLPDAEEAIITDTGKVVNTVNSLCIEMDERYELLKNAQCRNLKEYNAKFIKRKLNPENGHRYLPYIVLVIDEFADLIMTAGKEIETPIARLAQLARAIGIHLIVATQRPSVNIITGTIKANFPTRMAFRVTSKIDSRTILDAGGAEQLIGRGDMLISNGNDIVRIQCAFVDTPEVEEITDFIGNQQGYPDAFMLPEYVGESAGGGGDIDIDDRDVLFEDAAKVVVMHQQGSASLLQRKLKLGYNRAGRIVDQLEAAGIIGPFEGSKARQVLVPDEISLERLLRGVEED